MNCVKETSKDRKKKGNHKNEFPLQKVNYQPQLNSQCKVESLGSEVSRLAGFPPPQSNPPKKTGINIPIISIQLNKA